MTEQDYLSWTRPVAILKCLGPRATNHQYTLFLCAVWRRQAQRTSDDRLLRAVERLERYCFDEVTLAELRPDLADLPMPLIELLLPPVGVPAASIITVLERRGNDAIPNAEKLALANLLRCVVGNPYTPVGVDPAWLRWNAGAIPRMAEAIHRERRWGDLPVLADALEEAGCDDSDILEHCRARREHAFGCWVLSLLRAKLAVRLVLSTPEVRLSGWRPDMVELENISTESVTIRYHNRPFEELQLLTLDESGALVSCQVPTYSEQSSPVQTIALGPGGVLRHHLEATRSLKQGIYTMQALFRHGGLDLRSRAFLFTVPTQA